MDGSNVNEENICFSSARNLFENSQLPNKPLKIQLRRSAPSPHVHKTGFKDRDSDCKGSAVISTATLKRQQRTDQSINDNDNNSNNNTTPISSGDRKTEISVLKINATSKAIKTASLTKGPTILKSDSSAFKMSSSQNKILAPFSDKNENVVKEESKKTVRFLDQSKKEDAPSDQKNETFHLNSGLPKGPTLKTIKTAFKQEDSRQQLLNEIISAAGKTLRSIPSEKVVPTKTGRVTNEPRISQEQNEASQVMLSTTLKQSLSVVKISEPNNGILSSLASTSKNTSSLAKQDPSFLPEETKIPHNHNNSTISKNSIYSLSKSSDNQNLENVRCSAVPPNQPPTPVTAGQMPTIGQGSEELIDVNGEVQLKNDDHVTQRMFLKSWDPTKLVKELYRIETLDKMSLGNTSPFLNKSGHVECLPISKTKDTFLKTWKRKFFRTHDGKISFYEGAKNEKEAGRLELGGGNVEEIGPRMLGIEDGRGHYLVVRCPSEQEAKAWKDSIHSQMVGDVSSNWIIPLPGVEADASESKRIVVIELGSCSVRAGTLESSPTLPAIFFPNIVATNLTSKCKVYGFEALKPDVRSTSVLSCPVKPSNKVDRYALEWESLPGLFHHVFKQVRLDPHHCSVMFCAPTNFNNQVTSKFMEIFFETFKVRAVSMASQTLLALYSYKVDTGIVVDIGEKIEILPIIDGFVVDGSAVRLPCGGQRVCEMFNSFLTGRKYRFSTDAEFHLIRYAVEKMCYVSMDYRKDFDECLSNTKSYERVLPLDAFDLPSDAAEPVSSDMACFRSPEGFFDMTAWGIDSPSLPQLIHKVISLCPIDSRRQMWRNIYLSGGVTLLPNFKERLEAELSKLTPPNVAVQVHASPYRYHASYVGACALANMEAFHKSCVTAEEWKNSSGGCLKKLAAF